MDRILRNPSLNEYQSSSNGNASSFPEKYLYDHLKDRSQVRHFLAIILKKYTFNVIPPLFLFQIDNLIILSDGMNMADFEGKTVTRFLDIYRRLVNPNLLFVSVDLSGAQSG